MIYPRVLHIGFNPIGSPTNTGITLGNMFAEWPSEHLYELYTVSRQSVPSGTRNVLVTPPWIAPVDGIGRRLLGNRIPSPNADGMNNSVRGRSDSLPVRYRVRAAAAVLNEVGPVAVRGRWLEPVAEFRPDVIHSLLGGVRVTKLVAKLAKRLDIPVVPHFMDNWLDNLFADANLFGFPRREVERSVDAVLRQAPLCLAIGEDMRAEFESRLGLPCFVVGNSVNFRDFEVSRKVNNSQRTMTYIGGLHLGRDEALGAVAASLSAQRDCRVELVIHAPVSDNGRIARLQNMFPGVVRSGGNLDPADVPRALVESDCLVFVESDRREILDFTRLSVSTKVPEYLASGRPVLIVGPEGQSSVKALRASSNSVWAPSGSLHFSSAVSEVLALSERNAIPLDDRIRQTYDRATTQARLRDALASAVQS